MMCGSQDMPSEIGCFSVYFSHPPWDEEVPHCRLLSSAAWKGLNNTLIMSYSFSFENPKDEAENKENGCRLP